MAERYFSLFSFFSFTDRYWSAIGEERQSFKSEWIAALERNVQRFDLYQVFPARADTDLLLWSNFEVAQTEDPLHHFDCMSKVINPFRHYLRPVESMWGFTGESSYARGKSAQAIDPFEEERKPYLIVYPFVKTVDWYRSGRDTRQGMMNEHIRIGHQYPEIKQLLLYSTGIADQEFIVVYETDDLPQFSGLVNELRNTEARRYTERDTPIFTCLFHPPQETLALFD